MTWMHVWGTSHKTSHHLLTYSACRGVLGSALHVLFPGAACCTPAGWDSALPRAVQHTQHEYTPWYSCAGVKSCCFLHPGRVTHRFAHTHLCMLACCWRCACCEAGAACVSLVCVHVRTMVLRATGGLLHPRRLRCAMLCMTIVTTVAARRFTCACPHMTLTN